MYFVRKTSLAALVAAGLILAANPAQAQTYYGENHCCPPATFSGECCQPSLPAPSYYAPQQFAPGAAYPQQYAAPPASVAPQFGVGTSQFSYRPLLPIAQQPAAVEYGQGILGQPTVYVPGQPVRNLLRYITPF